MNSFEDYYQKLKDLLIGYKMLRVSSLKSVWFFNWFVAFLWNTTPPLPISTKLYLTGILPESCSNLNIIINTTVRGTPPLLLGSLLLLPSTEASTIADSHSKSSSRSFCRPPPNRQQQRVSNRRERPTHNSDNSSQQRSPRLFGTGYDEQSNHYANPPWWVMMSPPCSYPTQ